MNKSSITDVGVGFFRRMNRVGDRCPRRVDTPPVLRPAFWGAMALLFAGAINTVAAADWLYTVRPGDNLWSLSEKHLVDGWRMTERLRDHNQISDAYRLRPGKVIRLPVHWLKVQPASAFIVERQGKVQVLSADGTEVPLEGDEIELSVGTVVRTGPDGFAIVRFADESEVRVRSSSELSLDAMSAYGTSGMVDSRLRLNRGRLESVIQRHPRGRSRYEISTPAAIAAVRGTAFRVSAGEGGVTRSEVTAGEIALTAATESTPVEAGFGTLAEHGKPPEPPRPLLPAPDLSNVESPIRSLDLGLAWTDVAGAHSYRVELYADRARSTLVMEQLSPGATFLGASPADGSYWLQVRAIDADGIEGHGAGREIVVSARPVPPSLLEPRSGERTHRPPKLWWARRQGVAGYRVQFAKDENFENIVREEGGIAGDTLAFSMPPAPGTYYWRVASQADDGRLGPYSEARQLAILAVPDPVVAAEPAVDDEALEFSWRASPHAAKYHFELASDREFTQPIVVREVQGRKLELEAPAPGTYFFRVRAVSADQVAGPFGPVQSFEVPDNFDRSFYWMMLVPLLMLL